MRAVASYAAGILTLAMILASGGAWSLTDETRLASVQLSAAHAAFPYQTDLPTPEPPPVVRPLPPGCRPGLVGATCAVTLVAGGLDVPRTAYDLVPTEVTRTADWRPLVSQFFESRHVDRALRIISCESGGRANAKNPTSTASGLFQHLGSLWASRSAKAGWAGSDIFDPVANVAVAAWLVYDDGGWSHWSPSGGCWG
jgi:hypothetical protein